MEQTVKKKSQRKLTADYFAKKARNARGPEKFLVMLEMNKYIAGARHSGISFEELEKQGFKFAHLRNIKNK